MFTTAINMIKSKLSLIIVCICTFGCITKKEAQNVISSESVKNSSLTEIVSYTPNNLSDITGLFLYAGFYDFGALELKPDGTYFHKYWTDVVDDRPTPVLGSMGLFSLTQDSLKLKFTSFVYDTSYVHGTSALIDKETVFTEDDYKNTYDDPEIRRQMIDSAMDLQGKILELNNNDYSLIVGSNLYHIKRTGDTVFFVSTEFYEDYKSELHENNGILYFRKLRNSNYPEKYIHPLYFSKVLDY